jgi:hypothetical protein
VSSEAAANTLASADSGAASPLIQVAAHIDAEHHRLGLAERLALAACVEPDIVLAVLGAV